VPFTAEVVGKIVPWRIVRDSEGVVIIVEVMLADAILLAAIDMDAKEASWLEGEIVKVDEYET
jgi:hypothetical protein